MNDNNDNVDQRIGEFLALDPEGRFLELKRQLDRAGVVTNAVVLERIRSEAVAESVDLLAWTRAAEAAAMSGSSGKRFNYFVAIYENLRLQRRDAHAEPPGDADDDGDTESADSGPGTPANVTAFEDYLGRPADHPANLSITSGHRW